MSHLFSRKRRQHYATPDRTVEELYQATVSKRMALLRAGYTVLEMWECEWDRLVDNNPAVSQFLGSFDLVAPLEPVRPSLGVEPARWPYMPWLERMKRYAMWMSPPCTRGSTKAVPTPSVIHGSSLNLQTSLWSPILVWPPWIFFPPLVCSTPSCLYAAAKSSPFLSAVPVSRQSRPNPC